MILSRKLKALCEVRAYVYNTDFNSYDVISVLDVGHLNKFE